MILPSYILIVLHECQACFLIIKKLLKFKSHHSLILKLILSHHQLPLQLLEILGAMLLRWEVKNEARAFRRGGGTSPGASKNETYLLAVVRNAKKKKTKLFWYCWLPFETDWRGYSFVLQFKSTVLKKKIMIFQWGDAFGVSPSTLGVRGICLFVGNLAQPSKARGWHLARCL